MLTMERRTEIFERMPVKKAVLTQVIPAIASQMITLIYNLADTFFVGILNEPKQTAAITVVFSSFLMLTAISNLFGVGGASAIARALGKKEVDNAKQISSVSFWCGLAASIVFAIGFLTLAKPVLYLCGATESTFSIAYRYALWVIVIGGPFTILNTLFANLVRAEGDAANAFIGVSIGGVINIILDPFFILPRFLGLGALGAGVATAISNMVGLLYFLMYLLWKRRTTVLSINPRLLKFISKHIKTILLVGFPSAIQYALTVVAVAAQSKFVSRYSTEAIAALGIVKKLDQLPLYFSIGVSNGLLPLLGYNYAAGNQERRRQAFRFGTVVSLGFSVVCLVAYELFAPQLASLFMKDTRTIEYGAVFLRSMVTAMPMMSVCYPMIIQFQAMGKAKESLVCSVLRKGVLDVPLLFMMDRIYPLYGCMWVQPIVDTISLIVAIYYYQQIRKKEVKIITNRK